MAAHDFENHLIRLPGGTSYAYDADSNRMGVTVGRANCKSPRKFRADETHIFASRDMIFDQDSNNFTNDNFGGYCLAFRSRFRLPRSSKHV